MSFMPMYENTVDQVSPGDLKEFIDISNGQGSTRDKVNLILNKAFTLGKQQNNQKFFNQAEALFRTFAQNDKALADYIHKIDHCRDINQRRKWLQEAMMNEQFLEICAKQIEEARRQRGAQGAQDPMLDNINELVKGFTERATTRKSQATYGAGGIGVALYDLTVCLIRMVLDPYLIAQGKEPLRTLNSHSASEGHAQEQYWDQKRGQMLPINVH